MYTNERQKECFHTCDVCIRQLRSDNGGASHASTEVLFLSKVSIGMVH